MKNIIKKATVRTVLGVYDVKKLIKKVTLNSIEAAKTVQLKVPISI